MNLSKLNQTSEKRHGLLCVRVGQQGGGFFPLYPGNNLIGRNIDPLFEVDQYVSPLHLQINYESPTQFVLQDLGSFNGVFFRIHQAESLSHACHFRLGQQLLRFDLLPPASEQQDTIGSPNHQYWGKITVEVGPNAKGSTFLLRGEKVIIGRIKGEILFPEDNYISGSHLELTFDGDHARIKDLESSNGTFLRLYQERAMTFGSQILIGQQLFQFI